MIVIREVGDHDEMVIDAAADKGPRKFTFQNVCDKTHQVVAFCHTVLAVVEAQTVHVKIKQGGGFVRIECFVVDVVFEFDQEVHVRQTGDRVGIKMVILEHFIAFDEHPALTFAL